MLDNVFKVLDYACEQNLGCVLFPGKSPDYLYLIMQEALPIYLEYNDDKRSQIEKIKFISFRFSGIAGKQVDTVTQEILCPHYFDNTVTSDGINNLFDYFEAKEINNYAGGKIGIVDLLATGQSCQVLLHLLCNFFEKKCSVEYNSNNCHIIAT